MYQLRLNHDKPVVNARGRGFRVAPNLKSLLTFSNAQRVRTRVHGEFYLNPDRAPLKEVLGGQYNYREGGRQVLRQGAKGRRRNRKWQCSKDPCAQKVSGGRTDPSPKYRWKVHG